MSTCVINSLYAPGCKLDPLVVGNNSIYKLDAFQTFDFIPIASTLLNLCHIISKIFGSKDLSKNRLPLDLHYISYLNQKKLLRCVISLVPILGNIAEIVYHIATKIFNFTFSKRLDVLNSVKTDPYAYQYIERCYQEDKEIALIALNKNGSLLEFAGKLRQDKEIVKTAYANDPDGSFCYADQSIRSDKNIILELLELSQSSEFFPPSWMGPLSILSSMDDSLRQDEEIACAIINHSGFCRKYSFFLDGSFKENKKVMLTLVKKFPECIKYASQELQADPDLRKHLTSKPKKTLTSNN